MNLTWEQKLAALQALTEVTVNMRQPGDWFINPVSCWVLEHGLCKGSLGQGATPQDAVEDLWRQYTEDISSDGGIGIRTDGKIEKCVRWNGFMWREINSGGH